MKQHGVIIDILERKRGGGGVMTKISEVPHARVQWLP